MSISEKPTPAANAIMPVKTYDPSELGVEAIVALPADFKPQCDRAAANAIMPVKTYDPSELGVEAIVALPADFKPQCDRAPHF